MDRDERAALRRELYALIERGELGLVEAVRMMRKVAGKTQAEYARLVGISPRVLIDFERGVGNPGLKTLERILAPFNLELTARRRARGDRERVRNVALLELARLWEHQPGRSVSLVDVAAGTPLSQEDVRDIAPLLAREGLVQLLPTGDLLLTSKGRSAARRAKGS